jgi:hypothetical protein
VIWTEFLVKDDRLAAGASRFLAKAQKRMEAFASGARVVVLASRPVESRGHLLARQRLMLLAAPDLSKSHNV